VNLRASYQGLPHGGAAYHRARPPLDHSSSPFPALWTVILAGIAGMVAGLATLALLFT